MFIYIYTCIHMFTYKYKYVYIHIYMPTHLPDSVVVSWNKHIWTHVLDKPLETFTCFPELL